MLSLGQSLKEVWIRGFRSIVDARVKLDANVNLFAGLNDHGKSNLFRSIHLFFKDEVEPGVPLNYDRDISRIGGKASKQLSVAIRLDSSLAHKKLLESIGRKSVQKTERLIIRRVWSRHAGGHSSRTEVILYRITTKELKVYTDAEYKGVGKEVVIPPRAPNRFRDEVSRLFNRFNIRYLPSSTTGTLFEEAGLAAEVKRFLFDSYAKEKQFRELGKSIKDLRSQFDQLVRSEFGDKIATPLTEAFPGLESANLQLPTFDEDLVFTQDVNIQRGGKPVALSSCGSGLQSVLILETLKFLDSRIVNRAGNLAPVVVWLIEEPEAFLYEDLVHAVGKTLSAAAKDFNVLVTTHSRELVYSVLGKVNWVALEKKGTTTSKTFDLGSEKGKEDFGAYASEQFGRSWLELQYERTVAELKKKPAAKPIIFVEGESDETILKKLFQLFPFEGGVEIRRAITNSSSNAEHVAKSVVEIGRLLDDRVIIGLFDNDLEGKKYFESLETSITNEPLEKCSAVILPCPPLLKEAAIGVPFPDGTLRDSQQRVDLEGISITIEALLDSDSLQSLLKSKNYIEDYWLGSKGGRQTDVIYTNLTHHGKQRKTQIARDVAEALTRREAGSLKLLRDRLGEILLAHT